MVKRLYQTNFLGCAGNHLCHIAQQAAPFFLVIGATMLIEFILPNGFIFRLKLSAFLLAALFALPPL